jgi:hypothetical protein
MHLTLNRCEDSINILRNSTTRNNRTMGTNPTHGMFLATDLDQLQTIHPEQGNIRRAVLPINTIHETTMVILRKNLMPDQTKVHSVDLSLHHLIAA